MRVHCFTNAYKSLLLEKRIWTLDKIKEFIAEPYIIDRKRVKKYFVDGHDKPIPISTLQQLRGYNPSAYAALLKYKTNESKALLKSLYADKTWDLDSIKRFITEPYFYDENGMKEILKDETGDPVKIKSLIDLKRHNRAAYEVLLRLAKHDEEASNLMKILLISPRERIKWTLEEIIKFIAMPFKFDDKGERQYLTDNEGKPIPIKSWSQLKNASESASNALRRLSDKNKGAKNLKDSLIGLGSVVDRCLYKATIIHNYIHYVYIGLTHNYNKRAKDHLKDDISNTSAIYRFLSNIGLKIEDVLFEQLTDYMEQDAAAEEEQKQISYYQALEFSGYEDADGYGYKVLNKKKGGGLGRNIVGIKGTIEVAARYASFYEMGAKGEKWLEKCSSLDVDAKKMWHVSRIFRDNIDSRIANVDKTIYLFRDRKRIGGSPFYVGMDE